MAYDIKIAGGTIGDGTGTPGHKGDVGIKDGMIAALDDEESPKELTSVYRARAEYTTERLTGTRCTPVAAISRYS